MFGLGYDGLVALGLTRIAIAGALVGSFLALAGRFDEATTTQGTISPPIHARNQTHAHDDGTSPHQDDIAIENGCPEGAQEQEALPWVTRAPCQ